MAQSQTLFFCTEIGKIKVIGGRSQGQGPMWPTFEGWSTWVSPLSLLTKNKCLFFTVWPRNLASSCEIYGIFKGVFTNGFLKVKTILKTKNFCFEWKIVWASQSPLGQHPSTIQCSVTSRSWAGLLLFSTHFLDLYGDNISPLPADPSAANQHSQIEWYFCGILVLCNFLINRWIRRKFDLAIKLHSISIGRILNLTMLLL